MPKVKKQILRTAIIKGTRIHLIDLGLNPYSMQSSSLSNKIGHRPKNPRNFISGRSCNVTFADGGGAERSCGSCFKIIFFVVMTKRFWRKMIKWTGRKLEYSVRKPIIVMD